jgi:exopolysaccharide production protein ExoZ
VIWHRHRLLLCTLLIALLAVASHHFTQTDEPFSFYGNSIVFEFPMGFLAYFAYRYKQDFKVPTWLLLCLGAAALISAVWLDVLSNPGAASSDRWLRFGIPTAILVICAVRLEVQGIALTWRPLADAGEASYLLYLAHPFVLGLLPLSMLGNWAVPIAIAVSVIAALALHHFMDKPIRHFLMENLTAGRNRRDATAG